MTATLSRSNCMIATRRSFLATSALAGCAGLFRASADNHGDKPDRILLSLKIGMAGVGGSLEEKFRIIKELGYDGIEISSPGGVNKDEARKASLATGLPIHGAVNSIHWRTKLSDPSEETRLNLAGDRSFCFNASYNELWRRGHVRCVGAGPAAIQQAYSWGSHASPLIRELRDPAVPEHADLNLSREELDRIITWVDLNGVYYPDYACAYPDSLTGRCPLDRSQLGRLSQLTGVPFDRIRGHGSARPPQISFERPELSPCLEKLTSANGPEYREALAIIRSGQQRLAERPRCDMPGFEASIADRRRERKYQARREIEARTRDAIRRGARIYDPGLDPSSQPDPDGKSVKSSD